MWRFWKRTDRIFILNNIRDMYLRTTQSPLLSGNSRIRIEIRTSDSDRICLSTLFKCSCSKFFFFWRSQIDLVRTKRTTPLAAFLPQSSVTSSSLQDDTLDPYNPYRLSLVKCCRLNRIIFSSQAVRSKFELTTVDKKSLLQY